MSKLRLNVSDVIHATIGVFGKCYFVLSYYFGLGSTLKWSKIMEESVKHRCAKTWRQRIETESRNVYLLHIQKKETSLKVHTHFGFNCD